MPCPSDSGGEDVVQLQLQRFQLVDNNNDGNFLTASKLTPHHLPIQSLDTNAAANPLTSNGAFWSPLKAIPLASYYKLHRVPSLSTMTEPDSDDMDALHVPVSESIQKPMEPVSENGVPNAVKLPRRESTTEPLEKMPVNGVHNKILEQVVRAPGRQPSPQPTHLSVPGSSQHKVLHEEGSGYVAPKFEGKELQMDQGMAFPNKKLEESMSCADEPLPQ